jgi:hypothetical protein
MVPSLHTKTMLHKFTLNISSLGLPSPSWNTYNKEERMYKNLKYSIRGKCLLPSGILRNIPDNIIRKDRSPFFFLYP